MSNEFTIRAFFDISALSCLWAGNDNAEEKWGYNIDLEEFPISDDLKTLIVSAQISFEQIIDHKTWKARRNKKQKCDELNNICDKIIKQLRNELSSEFNIVDELNIECS
jgi:hypothetical protein